jgi:hypothetical protein
MQMEKDKSNGKENNEEEGVPYDPREVDRRIKVMQQQRRSSYDSGYGMDYSPGALSVYESSTTLQEAMRRSSW